MNSDADYRFVFGSTNTSVHQDAGRGEVAEPLANDSYPPFIDLECSDVKEADLIPGGLHPFFRSADFIKNTQFWARECRYRQDTPGRVQFIVTSDDFTPFISLVRAEGQEKLWFSAEGNLAVDITSDDVGPFTLEVSSVEQLGAGHFTIQVICGAVTMTSKLFYAYQYFDHATQLLMSQADFLAAYANLVTAVNAMDMSVLPDYSMTLFRWDGVTFTQKKQAYDILPPYDGSDGLFRVTAHYINWFTTPEFVGNEYYLIASRSQQNTLDERHSSAYLIPPFVVGALRRTVWAHAIYSGDSNTHFGEDPQQYSFPSATDLLGPVIASLGSYQTSDQYLDIGPVAGAIASPTCALARDGEGNETPGNNITTDNIAISVS